MEDGQTSCARSPTFMRWSPSVQQGMTWFSANSAGSPRLRELSNTVPLVSVPS